METKYYECNFYYDDVQIKNIVPAKSKIIHLPLHFQWLLQNCLKNEAYDFDWSKFEININEKMETKYCDYNY